MSFQRPIIGNRLEAYESYFFLYQALSLTPLSCCMRITRLLVQSGMSPDLVCRVVHSRMVIFHWVMARGLSLKKINYSYAVRGKEAI